MNEYKLEELVKTSEIVRQVVKIRMKEAARRSEAQFYRTLSKAAPNPHIHVKAMLNLLPPRRLWDRPRRSVRILSKGGSPSEIACYMAALKYLSSDQEWAVNLRELINSVRDTMLVAGEHVFKSPGVMCQAKTDRGGDVRIIAVFQDLRDRVIAGLLARYFRNLLDPEFKSCSYAFRKTVGVDHHAGMEALADFSREYGEKPLWVAECDIRNFFDTIHHDVVIGVLNRFEDKLRLAGSPIDPRARQLFVRLLGCYTFPGTALPLGNAWLAERNRVSSIPWVEEELREFYAEPMQEPIGIPQGLALSGVIVNMLMHLADEAVLGVAADPNLFYARFCDDIIIVHPDREKCQQALGKYLGILKELKLVPHRPDIISAYGPNYYKCKSKAPYQWAHGKRRAVGIPWVSWVGYEVRRDGTFRIRDKSIKAESRKQISLVDKVLALVLRSRPDQLKGAGFIRGRVGGRLVAMAVGRERLGGNGQKQEGTPCWGNGFRLLFGRNHVGAQLKGLDRDRERQRYRLRHYLDRADHVQKALVIAGNEKKEKVPYPGAPCSYFGFFSKTHQLPGKITGYGK